MLDARSARPEEGALEGGQRERRQVLGYLCVVPDLGSLTSACPLWWLSIPLDSVCSVYWPGHPVLVLKALFAKTHGPLSCPRRSSGGAAFAHVCTQLFVTVIMCIALDSALQENKKETDFNVQDVCVCNNVGNEYVS